MNNRYILATFLGLGLLLTSCKDAQKTADTKQDQTEQVVDTTTDLLIGSWKDQSASALDFTMHADGTAQSDNMATLLYQKWYVQDNTLFLVAESIGNGQSSVDTIGYSIQKLSNSELILQQENAVLHYTKINQSTDTSKESSAEQASQILQGELILGHEVKTFKPCGSDQTFWVLDKTGNLQGNYTELTEGQKPYTPIFVEIEVTNKGKAKEGFAVNYEGIYEVSRVLQTRKTTNLDCQ